MPIRYKLTNQDGKTYNNTEWSPGKTYKTSGQGDLCGPGWLHCYDDPLVAVLMNPHHANFINPHICEVECSGLQKLDRGLKEGWTEMSFLRWIELPSITTIQRVAFGILCTKEVYSEPKWTTWAYNWLTNKDRSYAAAAAAAYANAAANANAAAAAAYANAAYANAAYAAANANAAYAAANANAAAAAAYANAAANANAAAAAAYAAAAAAYADERELNLISIAQEAMKYV